MTNKELTVNLTESDLNTLIRTSRQKFFDAREEYMKDSESLKKTPAFSLSENEIEVTQDSLDDMNYYFNLYSKLSKTKIAYKSI